MRRRSSSSHTAARIQRDQRRCRSTELLFAWGAAAVLVVSFAALALLWPQPRLEKPPGARCRWARPRCSAAARWRSLCGAIGVALLGVVIVAGYVGPDSAADNLAPTFIMITFWVGLVIRVDPVRRRLPRLQPVAGDRPRDGRAGRPPRAGAAAPTRSGSAAGPPRSGC